ncbi:MAG: thiamine diphosphokinase [Candidatus Poribacteria bacterium]|nr:thiamine diphosphokinase [Candidatus Poribacteria bacterium]
MTHRRFTAIFLNGFYDERSPSFYAEICRRETAFLSCADGALRVWDWLEAVGEKVPFPSVVVGDFDSMDTKTRARWEGRGAMIDGAFDRRTDKDFTDGQLALYAALDAGCREVVICGGLPNPTEYDHDHFLGNLFLLAEAHERVGGDALSIRFAEPRESIYLVHDELTIHRVGDGLNRVSFLPFGGEGGVASSEGLRWQLRDFTLPTTRANALRNEFSTDAPSATITLRGDSAPVLAIHNW